MLLRNLGRRPSAIAVQRLSRMASQLATTSNNGAGGHANGRDHSAAGLLSMSDLPKSGVFTSKLPTDEAFPTPQDSHSALRDRLGPRMVKGALYTYVRPEEKSEAVLAAVSEPAMRDLGLKAGEEQTEEFKQVMAGNKFFWDPETGKGVYPWAQCYGGWQFGSWAGQLGDGRAISLFETTNPATGVRYEVQLKGAGRTPYSRFADGKAVVRSSVREFVVSEALNGLGIPTTRALALTLTPKTMVQRERMEPGAIVCRFAQTWLRIGTFDIQRARGERDVIRKLADYLLEEVFAKHELPKAPFPNEDEAEEKDLKVPGTATKTETSEAASKTKASELELNRYAALYRQVCTLNARTVAAWQAYGFMNGVLNTDNTSLLGLSLDFGPFAFMDNFDPAYTPNHDDHQLRYSYRNQPSVIWWNLVRLGESLGELLGAGNSLVDDEVFVRDGVREEQVDDLVARAEAIIMAAGHEYQRQFLSEYKRLMAARLGLRSAPERNFDQLYADSLDLLRDFELDFNHFFRRLGDLRISDLNDDASRREKAAVFFHAEGISVIGVTEDDAREKIAAWLDSYRQRMIEDWGEGDEADAKRKEAMHSVNPKFVPRGWLLEEIIKKVQNEQDFKSLNLAMKMAENPFKNEWGIDRELEERWCGDVPKMGRGIMCSCSS